MKKTRKIVAIVSVVILLVVSLALTLTSCAPKVYKLNFDVDGAVVKTIDIPSVATPELPYTPVKSGYTFAGWYFDKATLSDPCTAETIANKQFTADTVAYAKWLKNDYSITYNLDGGTEVVANPSGYVVDTATITLADPTKLGYTFGGWYGKADFEGTAITEIAKGSTGNKTLYAKWTKNDYTITYNLDGGINGANPTTYAVDTVTFKLTDPTKLYYTFGGWYDNAEFKGNAITAITKGSTGNKTLYAKWTAVVYTIKYVTNCATNVADTTYDILTMPNSFAILTREGYVFEGWYDNTDIECNVITAITKDNIGSKILVAKWTKNDYSITYNLDGGTNVVANPTTYNVDTATFTLADPAKGGYTFGGWFEDDKFTKVITEIATGSIGDKTLFAKWTKNDYSITYNLYGGINGANPSGYDVDTVTIKLADPSKVGYTFGGWFGKADFRDIPVTEIAKGSTGNKTLFAKWTIINYEIKYTGVEGATNTNPTTYNVDTVTFKLADPTKLGYTFGGWYDNAEFKDNAITAITKGSTGNKTLYAKLTKDSYTITYTLNGGINGANPTTYAVDMVTFKLADPTKLGYTFGGWFGEGDFSGTAITEIAIGSTGNKTLYAKLTKDSYTIVYNLDGGTNGANLTTYAVDTATIKLVDPTKVGYTFGGWFGEANFSGMSITEIATGSTGNKTLFAKWTIINYDIKYIGVEGATNTNPTTYNVASGTINIVAPTKAGYTFTGWSGTDLVGAANMTFTILAKSTGIREYTAHWTKDNYTITYELNGGREVTANPTTYAVDTATITLATPTKLGYTFGGWFGEANFSGTAITEIAIGSTGNKTLYVKWTATNYDITYNLDGGTNSLDNPNKYTIESGAIHIVAPTKVGYTFTGWSGTDLVGAANMTFTILAKSTGIREYVAHWTKDSYTITYNLDGGSNGANPTTYAVDTATIKLATPTKVGYTFGGWFGEANFSGTAVTEIAIGSTGNKTLYAKWTITTYTITYVGVDGVGAINPNATIATYTINSELITIQEATWKEGATFVGWSADGNVAHAVKSPTITKGSTGDITYTAHWTFITYAITYELDGGINNPSNVDNYNIDTATITFAEPTHNDRTDSFDGWYTALTGGNKITTIARGTIGALTLYARWNFTATAGLTYTLINSNTEYEVSGATMSGEVVIPRRHDNKLVTKIATNAFLNQRDITSVVIPSSVTSIGRAAFESCANVMSINIPDAVTSILANTFKGCATLVSIKIPESVTSIGDSAFYNCAALTSVNIPSKVKIIENLVFRGCKALASVTIQDSVTSIGDRAFQSCSILESIFIPSSVVTMGAGVFNGCTALIISCQRAENPNPGWNDTWMGNVPTTNILWGQARPTTTP